MFYFQHIFMLNPAVLLATQSTVLIPQIIHNFHHRSRKGPQPLLLLCFFFTQSLLTIYLKLFKDNFLEVEAPQYTTVGLVVGSWGLQAAMLFIQQKKGGRWFIPKKYRGKNPNYYEYRRQIP